MKKYKINMQALQAYEMSIAIQNNPITSNTLQDSISLLLSPHVDPTAKSIATETLKALDLLEEIKESEAEKNHLNS